MSIADRSDESLLRFHEDIRIQAAADRTASGRFHLLGDTARQRADVLREEIYRRRLRTDRID